MIKEEEFKTQVACYTDHLLKSKRENKGKGEQLERNYELLKHLFIYIYIRMYVYMYMHTRIYTYSCDKYKQHHKNSKFQTSTERNICSQTQRNQNCDGQLFSGSTPGNTHYCRSALLSALPQQSTN